MPTENDNLQPIVRDINVLLSLDTYQGMSDAEIESVLEFKIKEALDSDVQKARLSAIQEQANAQSVAYQSMADDAHDVLYSVLERTIPWATISADGTVIQNV